MKKLTATIAVLMLAGCSSGPSDGAMEEALLAYVKDNADSSATIENFKAGECSKGGDKPGYTCSVSADFTIMQGSQRDQLQGAFTFDKIDGTWKVVGRTM